MNTQPDEDELFDIRDEHDSQHVAELEAMNTPSPFAEVQRLQEQQREGWVEETTEPDIVPDTPRTNALRSRYPIHSGRRYSDELTLCAALEKQLAEKDAKIAKIAEQEAQIVALRGCLEHLTAKDWFTELECILPHEHVTCSLDARKVRAALSTPAPKVVPLEDVSPLVETFKEVLKSAMPHPAYQPSMYKSWQASNQVLETFTTKHPL